MKWEESNLNANNPNAVTTLTGAKTRTVGVSEAESVKTRKSFSHADWSVVGIMIGAGWYAGGHFTWSLWFKVMFWPIVVGYRLAAWIAQ